MTNAHKYKNGGGFRETLGKLYKEGGVRRLYRGYLPALIQGPVSRFGDTAANAGILAFMEHVDLPVGVKTIFASAAAAAFRMFLIPIDTLKTTMQVSGNDGVALLRKRIATNGVGSLWYGAFATSAATFAGHYPWFATYNSLQASIPKYDDVLWKKLARNAGIGFCASVVSDTISNSLRVIKTYRQTNATKISYAQTVKEVVAKDGWIGLFGRGLKTRLLANGLQGLLFSVLWKQFEEFVNILYSSFDLMANHSQFNKRN